LLFAEKHPPSNTPKRNTSTKKARITRYEDDLDDTASYVIPASDGGKRKNYCCSKSKRLNEYDEESSPSQSSSK